MPHPRPYTRQYLQRRAVGAATRALTTRNRFKSGRRRYKKALRLARPSNFLAQSPLMPIRYKCRLRYNESVKLVGTAATANAYILTANGLFDPNITGAGHQPMGFDQIMLWYEHYHVTNCKLTVNFCNNSSADNIIVGIYIAPDTTVTTDFIRLVENGMMVKKWMGPGLSNSKNICTLALRANIAQVNGQKTILYTNDFRGDVGANPVEQTYFHIFIYDPFNLAATPQIDVDFLLEYDAVFSEPRKLTLS